MQRRGVGRRFGGWFLRGALGGWLVPARLRAREKDPLSPVTRAVLALIQALLPAMIDQGLNE